MNLVQTYLTPFATQLNTLVSNGTIAPKRMENIVAGKAKLNKKELAAIQDATDGKVDPNLLQELHTLNQSTTPAEPQEPAPKSVRKPRKPAEQHSSRYPRARSLQSLQRVD